MSHKIALIDANAEWEIERRICMIAVRKFEWIKKS